MSDRENEAFYPPRRCTGIGLLQMVQDSARKRGAMIK